MTMKRYTWDCCSISNAIYSSKFFRILILMLLISLCGNKSYSQNEEQNSIISERRNFLISIMPPLEKIDRFLGKAEYIDGYNPNWGWTFDSDLGWVLQDAFRKDGINNSYTFYHYEKSGARKRVNFPRQKARIQAYGNSFTHCDQVNDGETWEEYLAGHLCEPIDNFGVGGYSV